jgi:hypothetical protein
MMITPIQNNPLLPLVPLSALPVRPPVPKAEKPNPEDEIQAILADISPIALLLSEEGLDFESSSITKDSTDMHFKLEFSSQSMERVSASGYYSEETKTLDLTWQVTFQREVEIDGGIQQRTYEAELRVHLSKVSSIDVSSYVQKEDILSMVRRLLENLNEIIADEDKALGGVVLDFADIHELFAIDDGKLAHDLMALIELTIMLSRLRHMLEGDEELVILNPEREETRGDKAHEVESVVESFQLEIRDVTAELSTTTDESESTISSPHKPGEETQAPLSPA